MVSAKSTISVCPKCGYDQSGEIATWESVCPMAGQCPECGLEFAWGEVFDPDQYELPWYIETARTKRQLIWRTVQTLWFLFVPSWYWREVNVQTRFRFARLIGWLGMVFVLMHLLSSVSVAMGNWTEFGQWRYVSLSFLYTNYGVVGVARELFNAISTPYFRIQYDAVGQIHLGWMNSRYQSPLANFRLSAGYFAFSSMWVLALLVYARTRAKAQLRYMHIFRAFLLSLVAVLAVSETQRAFVGLYAYWDGYGNTVVTVGIPMIINVLLFIWIQWFWIAAIHIGWKMRPSLGITITGTLASSLAGAAVFSLISGL